MTEHDEAHVAGDAEQELFRAIPESRYASDEERSRLAVELQMKMKLVTDRLVPEGDPELVPADRLDDVYFELQRARLQLSDIHRQELRTLPGDITVPSQNAWDLVSELREGVFDRLSPAQREAADLRFQTYREARAQAKSGVSRPGGPPTQRSSQPPAGSA